MITRLETIDLIKPVFRAYLEQVHQFLDIYHFEPWCDTALKNLDRYGRDKDRSIYILKKADDIIGFALINKHLRFNTDGFAIAEFFICKSHEKKGYGRHLAEHVFSLFPGNWEIAVSLKNKNALAFWEQVVSSFTHGNFIKKEKPAFKGYGIIFKTSP